jgi:hypothetical protein
VKAEIVSRYSAVDAYYSAQIERLKEGVLEAFFAQTGDLKSAILPVGNAFTNDERIERLVNELDSTVRENDFTSSFKFISNVSFEFSQNVFSNIYRCVDQLQRQIDSKGNSLSPPSLNDNKIDEGTKIKTVETSLKQLSPAANAAIRQEILRYDDNFNEFLAICMSFFNDFLFRKDVDTFRYCIRSLITEYREFLVPPKAQNADERKEKLVRRIKENITAVAGGSAAPEQLPSAPREMGKGEVSTPGSSISKSPKAESGYTSNYEQEW